MTVNPRSVHHRWPSTSAASVQLLVGKAARRKAQRARKRARQGPQPPKKPVLLESTELAAQATKTGDDVLQRLKRWVRPDDLPSDPADLRIYHVPRTQTMEEQLLTARRVQDSIDDGKHVLPCAVCACYVGRGAVAEESCPLADIPAWQLLDANLPSTLEMPRHAVTLVQNGAVSLCLSPEG